MHHDIHHDIRGRTPYSTIETPQQMLRGGKPSNSRICFPGDIHPPSIQPETGLNLGCNESAMNRKDK